MVIPKCIFPLQWLIEMEEKWLEVRSVDIDQEETPYSIIFVEVVY
jgi:hypothetical protein